MKVLFNGNELIKRILEDMFGLDYDPVSHLRPFIKHPQHHYILSRTIEPSSTIVSSNIFDSVRNI